MKMKTSTEIGSSSKIVGYGKAVELVAKAGFDAWDFSLFGIVKRDGATGELTDGAPCLSKANYIAYAKELRKIGEDLGIHCNQSHAPLSTGTPGMPEYLKRAIECTAVAGGKICVVHPVGNEGTERNVELYNELLPFAREHGVKIAAENLFRWNEKTDTIMEAACSNHETFLELIEAVGDPYLVACLDIGHAEMQGLNTSAEQMVLTLGKHIQALHIHDNGKIRDDHQIPFSMNIDYGKIVRALKKVGYSGYFTLEADNFLPQYNEDNVLDGLRKLRHAVGRLCEMYEKE